MIKFLLYIIVFLTIKAYFTNPFMYFYMDYSLVALGLILGCILDSIYALVDKFNNEVR